MTALKDPLAGIEETSAFDALPPVMSLDGGKGSGNFGHAGRPGKVGGSQTKHGEEEGSGSFARVPEYWKPTGIVLNKNGEKTLDKAERKRYSDILIRHKTPDGVRARSLSEHAYQRIAERGISPGRIKDSLRQRGESSKTDIRCLTYDGSGIRTVLDKETGVVVTVYKRRRTK